MVPAISRQVEQSPIKLRDAKKAWSATFPESVTERTDAGIFMTRCLYVTFAHILESRRLLPPSTFKKRCIGDIIKTYVFNSKDPLGSKMGYAFRGVANAIELGYLKELMIVVSKNPDDSNDAFEVFTWSMFYDGEGGCSAALSNGEEGAIAQVKYTGPDSVKSQTRNILLVARKLCREILSPLPADAYSTFRITYTDGTPKGYQADGFSRIDDHVLYALDPSAKNVYIGGVATPFHKSTLSAKSIYVNDEYTVSVRLTENLSDVSMNETYNMNISALNNTIEEARGEDLPADTPVFDEHMMNDNSMLLDNSIGAVKGSSAQSSVESLVRTSPVKAKRGRKPKKTVTPTKKSSTLNSTAKSPGEMKNK